MASLQFTIFSLTMLFIITMLLFPSSTLSQNTNPPSIPIAAQCAPRLLPLVTCAPFVQGTSPSPGQSCCDNLNLVYIQQPSCLCLVLNSTTLSSFPINSTLALQLPALCSIPVDPSACLGILVPPSSSSSQVTLGGAHNTSPATNATIAASPVFQAPPPQAARASTMKLNTGSYAATVIVAGILFLF